jgi:hypothetical protein
MKRTTLWGVFLCLSLSGFTVRSQNLISNGDFELPGFDSPPSDQILVHGDTRIIGWTVTEYTSVQPSHWMGTVHNTGHYAIGLAADTGISTTFPTLSNTVYELSFWMLPVGDEGPLQVTVAGLTTYFMTLDGVGTNLTVRFTAERTEPSATLEFRNFAEAFPISIYYYLDTVSVVAVAAKPDSPHLTIKVSQVELCWESEATHFYQIQYRSDLTTNEWVDLGAPIVGNGTTNCIPESATFERRFYRVVVQP